MVQCGFTQSEYPVSESAGFVTICVELTADAPTQTDIPFDVETMDITALGKEGRQVSRSLNTQWEHLAFLV